jgi:hypothetical protein
MSLNVYLEIDQPHDAPTRQAIFVCRGGAAVEITREDWDALHPGVEPAMTMVSISPGDPARVFEHKITHNLRKLAEAAGIYRHLWRPEEIDISHARQLVESLSEGLQRLKADPETYRRHSPPNGWRDYDGLVAFVEAYLAACREHPEAKVRVWR